MPVFIYSSKSPIKQMLLSSFQFIGSSFCSFNCAIESVPFFSPSYYISALNFKAGSFYIFYFFGEMFFLFSVFQAWLLLLIEEFHNSFKSLPDILTSPSFQC